MIAFLRRLSRTKESSGPVAGRSRHSVDGMRSPATELSVLAAKEQLNARRVSHSLYLNTSIPHPLHCGHKRPCKAFGYDIGSLTGAH